MHAGYVLITIVSIVACPVLHIYAHAFISIQIHIYVARIVSIMESKYLIRTTTEDSTGLDFSLKKAQTKKQQHIDEQEEEEKRSEP